MNGSDVVDDGTEVDRPQRIGGRLRRQTPDVVDDGYDNSSEVDRGPPAMLRTTPAALCTTTTRLCTTTARLCTTWKDADVPRRALNATRSTRQLHIFTSIAFLSLALLKR